jgi:hypothetical protein
MKSNLGLAARTLVMDLALGEVIRCLAAEGIDAILLKGPAMAHHLYGAAPGTRNYGDVDLLVAPGQFDAAGRTLASLGFEDQLAGIRASEAARLHARPWHRDGAAPVAVDLHRGFHSVADRSAWWNVLHQHREVLVVEGQAVAIPDRIGCALIAALHASDERSLGKPFEDLRRALQLFDGEVWRQAAGLARSVGAGSAFAAVLCREQAGAELSGRLGLTVGDPAAWFRATSFLPGTGSLSLVLAPGTRAARARRLRDVAFPSPAVFAAAWPIAQRGRAGLAIARLGRLCVIAARLPRLLLAWHGAGRALRHRSARAPRAVALRPAALAGRRGARTRRARGRAAAGISWWTLRTWWRVHRRLARGGWGSAERGNAALLPPAGRAGPPPGGSARAARLVLACCRATCLEIALVRQARAAGAGVAVDVIVGVTAPASGFRAHAWVDGDRVDPQFAELWRFPAVLPGPAGSWQAA